VVATRKDLNTETTGFNDSDVICSKERIEQKMAHNYETNEIQSSLKEQSTSARYQSGRYKKASKDFIHEMGATIYEFGRRMKNAERLAPNVDSIDRQ
jgi:hypothetical protein